MQTQNLISTVGFYWPALARLFDIGNVIRTIQNLLIVDHLLGIDCYKLDNWSTISENSLPLRSNGKNL